MPLFIPIPICLAALGMLRDYREETKPFRCIKRTPKSALILITQMCLVMRGALLEDPRYKPLGSLHQAHTQARTHTHTRTHTHAHTHTHTHTHRHTHSH